MSRVCADGSSQSSTKRERRGPLAGTLTLTARCAGQGSTKRSLQCARVTDSGDHVDCRSHGSAQRSPRRPALTTLGCRCKHYPKAASDFDSANHSASDQISHSASRSASHSPSRSDTHSVIHLPTHLLIHQATHSASNWPRHSPTHTATHSAIH